MESLGVVLCSLVLTASPTLAAADSTFTPSPISSPAGLDKFSATMEEVQVNLLVNQLAIIRILNETRASPVVPGFGVREVLEEVRKLQTNLATMHGDLVATLRENTATSHHGPEPQSEVNEREIEQLKQILEALGDTVASQGRKIEENGHETGQLKEILVILNGSVTSLGHEIEEQKWEIEEQKREIEEQKTEIEEQKTEIEEQRREIEEQKTEIELLKEIKATTYEDCSLKGDLHVNDNCSISVCQRGFLLPYQGSSAPNISFSDLLTKNCIHLERGHKSWDEARANCVALGGDLFVAGDLRGAEQYLNEQENGPGLSYWPWVGVKGREWTDGRPVASGEWDSSFPNPPLDNCAFLYKNGLQDATCSSTYTSLCVKGTTY